MKLFVIYIGGLHEKSLIELHDIYLSLEPTDQPKIFEFTCQYTPIGR